MNIEITTAPNCSAYKTQLDELREILQASRGFEALIYSCLQNNWSMNISNDHDLLPDDDARPGLLIGLHSTQDPKKENLFAFLRLAPELVKSFGKFTPMPDLIQVCADSDGYALDEEWFTKRNAELKIKEDTAEGELVVPARMMTRIILAYALSKNGMVQIRRDMAELWSGVPWVVRMNLIYGDRSKNQAFSEELIVIMDKLEKVLRSKGKKDFCCQ